MQEEKNEKILLNTTERAKYNSESPESYKNVNQDDIVICNETEKPIRLSFGFKFLLGFGIFLSGFTALPYAIFFPNVFNDLVNTTDPYAFTISLKLMLFYTVIFLCFLMLVSVAISKRPFNGALYRLGIVIGILITASAFLFPRIDGYDAGFQILSNGSHFVADGVYLLIGLLICVMALLMRYGYIYQSNSDMNI